MTTVSHARTFLDALADAIEAASAHNRQDQVPPVAVLWPDEDRQWEALLPLLKDRLPLFVLGKYSPEQHIGPAYWLRCIIARTIPHPGLPPEKVPVLYLPDFSRQHIRSLEDCPAELKPLAELQYRGVLWTQKNGRDWTVNAFLQSRDGGLRIRVEADQRTKEALQRSLEKLAEEPIEAIHRAAPLRAFYLDGLIHPDNVKNVLRWLNDPKGYRDECSDQEWPAFVALCESYYDFHPDRDSPVTAAEKLGQQQGNWVMVWRRFAEAPASYSTIPDRLREAKPQMTLPLLDHSDSWPQNNETAEASLRDALLRLSNLDSDAARRRIRELEQGHGERRSWVWASLGSAPLAQAIEHLATMARFTERMAWGNIDIRDYAEICRRRMGCRPSRPGCTCLRRETGRCQGCPISRADGVSPVAGKDRRGVSERYCSFRARRLPSGISTGGCQRNVSAIRRWSSVRSGTPPWNDVGTEGDRGGSRATSNGSAIGDRYGEACNLSCGLRVSRWRRLRNCCKGERVEGHRSASAEGGGRCGLPGPGS